MLIRCDFCGMPNGRTEELESNIASPAPLQYFGMTLNHWEAKAAMTGLLRIGGGLCTSNSSAFLLTT